MAVRLHRRRRRASSRSYQLFPSPPIHTAAVPSSVTQLIMPTSGLLPRRVPGSECVVDLRADFVNLHFHDFRQEVFWVKQMTEALL